MGAPHPVHPKRHEKRARVGAGREGRMGEGALGQEGGPRTPGQLCRHVQAAGATSTPLPPRPWAPLPLGTPGLRLGGRRGRLAPPPGQSPRAPSSPFPPGSSAPPGWVRFHPRQRRGGEPSGCTSVCAPIHVSRPWTACQGDAHGEGRSPSGWDNLRGSHRHPRAQRPGAPLQPMTPSRQRPPPLAGLNPRQGLNPPRSRELST